jgi:hypothetical protein
MEKKGSFNRLGELNRSRKKANARLMKRPYILHFPRKIHAH